MPLQMRGRYGRQNRENGVFLEHSIGHRRVDMRLPGDRIAQGLNKQS